jgi:hypothetical protein
MMAEMKTRRNSFLAVAEVAIPAVKSVNGKSDLNL